MRFGGFVCMASLLEWNRGSPRPTAPVQGSLPQRHVLSGHEPNTKSESRNHWLVLSGGHPAACELVSTSDPEWHGQHYVGVLPRSTRSLVMPCNSFLVVGRWVWLGKPSFDQA